MKIDTPHLIAGIKWLGDIAAEEKWDLSIQEQANLIGMQKDKFLEIVESIKRQRIIELPDQTIERLSLLLGIWKCLQLIVPSDREDLAYEWFRKSIENEVFTGQSIKQFLLNHNHIESFYRVRAHLSQLTQC